MDATRGCKRNMREMASLCGTRSDDVRGLHVCKKSKTSRCVEGREINLRPIKEKSNKMPAVAYVASLPNSRKLDASMLKFTHHSKINVSTNQPSLHRALSIGNNTMALLLTRDIDNCVDFISNPQKVKI